MRETVIFYLLLMTLTLSAHPPWGIQVGEKGEVYFVDILHEERGALWKFDPVQDQLTCLLSDFHSHNVQLDQHGNIYLAHGEGHQTMVRYCPDGTLDTLLSVDSHREFNGGNCVISSLGVLHFYANKHLWKRRGSQAKSKVTERTFEWSQTTSMDHHDNIYLPEIGSGNGDVFRISPDGEVAQIASDLITKLDRPRDKHMDVLLGISTDEEGTVYVCETAGKRVARIKGETVDTWYLGTEGWYPTGLTFQNGEAYILEHQWTRSGLAGPRVIKRSKEGSIKVLVDLNTYDHSRIAR